MNLNKKAWKQYHIGELFTVKRPAARNKDDYQEGSIPFVASGAINNGVTKCCEPKLGEMLNKSDCVTVSPVDGSAFYQPFDFLGRGGAGSSILMLYSDFNEKDSGLFVAKMISQTCSKYTYGHMGNKDEIKREIVQLPVTKENKPDYEYMAQYVKTKRKSLLAKYREFILKRMSKIEYKDIPTLEEKEWRKFRAFGENGLLNIKTTSSSIDSIRLINGDNKVLPYVTRTDTNNGIASYVSRKNMIYGYDNAGCITIGLDTQTAFWQPHRFITGQNIQVIVGNILNENVAQFIIPLLKNQMRAKFNWGGNGATLGRMRMLKLMLPVTDTGKPDYQYMEQYSRNMMYKKYNQYLKFLNKHM